MAYDPYFRELLAKVEKTRPARVARSKKKEFFTKMTAQERTEILKNFHPDFRSDSKRQLRIGPSKDAWVYHEVADLLESRSLLSPDSVDLSRADEETDVLIIGGGGAGSAAALMANGRGAKVLLCTKLRHGDANTMMAEGGIQAADKENDSPPLHYLDVMGGGKFTNHPDLVEALVMDAPEAIAWLEDLGVMFDKEPDGTMKTLHGGGTCRKRMHSCGDITGAEIMRTLRDEVRNHPEIRVLEFTPAVELLLDGQNRCAGAVLYNLETQKYSVVKAKTTILATGGFGRLHLQKFPTSNHYGATADGLALAYRAGGQIVFLDKVQFHPTGVIYPEQNIGLLVTEKFRGAGALLLNVDAEEFIYSLETRDVVSSGIIRECSERGKGIKTPTGRFGVWLDSPMIESLKGPGSVKKLFPGKFKLYHRYGIDISKEPMLIYPTLHYQNGGILIKASAESLDIENLFVAGEASGGVHGNNRLMGNSLLDCVVYGRRSGVSAAERSREVALPEKLSLEHARRYNREIEALDPAITRTSPILLPDYAGKIA